MIFKVTDDLAEVEAIKDQLRKRITQLQDAQIAVRHYREFAIGSTRTNVLCRHRKTMNLCVDTIDFKPGFRPYEKHFIHKYELVDDFWDNEVKINPEICYICGADSTWEDPFDPKRNSVLGEFKRY